MSTTDGLSCDDVIPERSYEAQTFIVLIKQIYDKYHWLEEDSGRRDAHLSFEEYTLRQYLNFNAFENDWTKVKKIFRDVVEHKLFMNVQYRNWYTFYSYMDFSRAINKPARSLKGLEPHIVLDSNKISGTVIEHEYSPNGKYCAFTISNEVGPSFIHIVDVETGENYGRSLKFPRFYKKIIWSEDSKGFFVYYDPRGGDNRSIFYHYLDNRKRDVFIVAIKRSETHTSSFHISSDYKYLILRPSRGVSGIRHQGHRLIGIVMGK
ncbi:hypothetical protein Bhyg_08549 [Pseudolycoriella hygida]|uniref:Peptidase S9A N-terminal domain-containing protein n=1 Tax=Pseudolycoriella hygida TaxID=35572 RepID=A0A9Q0N5X7_9DIPT|nr:hypothetical protein Bhyg_08549 [Pseudolycoriella hygida]